MADSNQAPSETPTQPATPDPGSVAAPAAATPPAESTPKPVESGTPPAAVATPAAKPAEGAAPAAQPVIAPAPTIPETYAIKAPEGMQLDADVIPALTPVFKDLKLSQDQVQSLANRFIAYQKDLPARTRARDLEVTMKDPEVGGLNYGRTQGYVNAALSAFTTPEFRAKLDRWGVSNDLDFVRFVRGVGEAMASDGAVPRSPNAAPEESRADRIYGRAKKA